MKNSAPSRDDPEEEEEDQGPVDPRQGNSLLKHFRQPLSELMKPT